MLAKSSRSLRPDGRSRIGAEFSALEFLWEHGIRQIPRPIAVDLSKGCAVVEYIEGRPALEAGVTAGDLEDAVGFMRALKALSLEPSSCAFPPASEAAFSVQGILETIQRRLERLYRVVERGSAGEGLKPFLEEVFIPALEEERRRCQERVIRAGISLEAELPPSARTLSPSDFGFHNALRRADGRLVFCDFEHFGWDDPSKTIADFILHPAMRLSEELKRGFINGMLRVFAEDPRLAWRLETLYPLLGLKWALILLNEFVPEDLERRRFASDAAVDVAALQRRQLDKAAAMVSRVRSADAVFAYAD